MKKLFCFLAGCLLFLASGPALRAQTPSASADSLMRQFQQVAGYDQRWTREQVFVHLDNNGYFEGETIWFSAYVVRASTLRPTKLSRVLYVELLNAAGDVMERRKVRIDHEGRASGDIKLDAQTVRSGFYEIRAYTRAMLNWDAAAAFSRVVPVFRKPAEDTADGELVIGDAYAAGESPSQRPKKDDDPFLLAAQSEDGVLAAFYPEGGQRVEGQPSLVAFRLTDKRGNPIKATCRAYDTGGQLLATASAVHEGMGSFTLPATAGAAYATVEHGGTTTRFDLPAPVPGYALSATWASADSLRLTVAGSASLAGRLLGLSVTARGRACFFDTIAVAGAAPVERHIPRAALCAGDKPELRILGVFSKERLPEYPDVPTLGELGYYGEWYGSARALVLPKGVSQEIVDFYVNAFRKTMQDPACIEAHAKAGMSLDFKDNKQLAELIAAQEKFCRDTVAKLYKK